MLLSFLWGVGPPPSLCVCVVLVWLALLSVVKEPISSTTGASTGTLSPRPGGTCVRTASLFTWVPPWAPPAPPPLSSALLCPVACWSTLTSASSVLFDWLCAAGWPTASAWSRIWLFPWCGFFSPVCLLWKQWSCLCMRVRPTLALACCCDNRRQTLAESGLPFLLLPFPLDKNDFFLWQSWNDLSWLDFLLEMVWKLDLGTSWLCYWQLLFFFFCPTSLFSLTNTVWNLHNLVALSDLFR